jgi:hypothetical protein
MCGIICGDGDIGGGGGVRGEMTGREGIAEVCDLLLYPKGLGLRGLQLLLKRLQKIT